MVVSGRGEGAVEGSGGGERPVEVNGEGHPAVAISDVGERAVEGSGKDEGRALPPLDSLEYPCTRRLRLRRLLAYLRGYSHWGAYDAVNGAAREIFHASKLVKHVKAGQWCEALHYVLGFVNLRTSGHEARSLFQFLDDFKAINSFADGGTVAATASHLRSWFLPLYKHPVLDKYPCFATLVADFISNRSDHARAFLDWQLVRNKAAAIAKELASKTPELKDKLHLPRGRNSLYDVVTVGSGFRRRHAVKNLSRKQSTDLAQFYLQAKKRLPSSIQGAIPDYSAEESEMIPADTLIELFEKALQAGKRLVPKQAHPPEYSSKEGAPLSRPKMVANPLVMIALRSQGHHPGHLLFKQGHHAEYSSKQVVPLVRAMVDNSSFMSSPLRGQGHQPGHLVLKQRHHPEHSSKQAEKQSSFQESRRDTAHPGNDSKRQRTTGNFGDGPSSSFRTPHLVSTNEGSSLNQLEHQKSLQSSGA